VAYAGDLKGNVWRFSLTANTATALFTGNSRPISAAPLVVRNQKTGATWVFVGTGRYLNKDDLIINASTPVETWYGLIDNGTTITSRNQLMPRGFEANGVTLQAGTEYEILADPIRNRGWYIDFTRTGKTGERMMTPDFILGGALFGITFIPDASDPCAPNGSSSLWAINPFSGARIDQGVFDLNGDGTINNPDLVGGLYPSVIDGLSAVTSSSPPITTTGKDGWFGIQMPDGTVKGKIPTGAIGRQSWREVVGQ